MRRAGPGRRHLLRDAWWLAALASGTWLVPDTARAEPAPAPDVPRETAPSDAAPQPPSSKAPPPSKAPPSKAPPSDGPPPSAAPPGDAAPPRGTAPPEPPPDASPPSVPPQAPQPPQGEQPPAALLPGAGPATDAPSAAAGDAASDDGAFDDGSDWPLHAPTGDAHGPTRPEAQDDDDPLHPPAAPLLSHDLLAAWKGDFERAKQLLRHGRFTEAAALFELIGPRAPTAEEAAIARELAALCYHWSSRGIRFDGAQPARSPHAPAGPRQRSSGEIASLYVNAVVYGLGTGTWLGVVADLDSAGGLFVPALALTGATLGVVAVVDQEVGFAYGVPQAISSGMYVGLSQGMLWSLAYNAQARAAEEWSATAVSSVMWGGATLGALAGGVIGHRISTTPGRAAWVGSTSLWGGAIGGLTVGGVVPDDARTDERALLGAALTSTAGTVAGLLTAESVSPSLARVRFLDLGGLVGGLLGLGVYATAAPSLETHGTLWAMNVGALTGLASSWVLTSGMQPDRGDEGTKQTARAPANPLQALSKARPTLLPAYAGAQVGLAGSW